MCTYSAIADNFRRTAPERHPWIPPVIINPHDVTKRDVENNNFVYTEPLATKQDIADLRKEMLALKDILKAALKFDEETGQKDCEQEDKIRMIRELAEMVGVDMEDCMPPKPEEDLVSGIWSDPRGFYADPAGTQVEIITSTDGLGGVREFRMGPLPTRTISADVFNASLAEASGTHKIAAYSDNVSWATNEDRPKRH